ncbi:DNA repair/transcription protein mms19 [Cyberlindnera fabianii]|uniref:MMS19 nucleotide excision repair protein n=1 Tax=Cyberlindnera fabianii TaxID=36022 RepID=A0A1V2LAX7_CYBFA|nr:DNA repair/transcription protein mms19 [Cyberlindnera fabianii]
MDRAFTKHSNYIKRFIESLYQRLLFMLPRGRKIHVIFSSPFHLIIESLNISQDQDDMFDILFCYFPISFKPPKDDPYKITSEMLKSALREGIATSPLFAKDAYPNLLEKLTSTSPTVKRDTIETITLCVKNYGIESLTEHWIELWDALKFEILHVYDELKPNLMSKMVKQTCALLGSIASAGELPFETVTNPVLGELLKDTKDMSVPKERTLVSNIGVFTRAYIEVYGTFDKPRAKVEVVMHLNLRTLSVAELTKITTLSNFLSDSELSLIVQYFTETVLFDDTDYVYNSCIGGLVQVSKIDTSILLEVTFPTLLSLLPDDDGEAVLINDEAKPKEKIFEILGATCTNSAIVNFMLIRLLNKLETVSAKPENLKYTFLIVSTLQNMIISSQRTQQFSTDTHLTKSFPKLVSMLLNTTSGALQDDNIMESASEILKLIVVYSSNSNHQQLLDETRQLFSGESCSGNYYKDITTFVNFIDSPDKFVNVMVKIIAGVDKSTKFDDVDDIIGSLVKIVETHEFADQYAKIGYLRLISLLVNKWAKDTKKYEDMVLDSITKIEVFTWIAKGVILKIDSESVVYITKLVDLLSDERWGAVATKSFEVLVVDMSIFEKFKKIMNNNVRLLYKQKFFEIVAPMIVERFTNATDMSIKSNYLTALSLILKHTKKEIITPHLSSFFPLLLQSLSLPNSDVRLASLQTILGSMDEISDLIGKHLSTIIPSLLSLVKVDEARLNTADVRVVAVNCLHGLTMIVPLEKLIGFQKSIIKELTDVLDDKKRKVRKGAVDARQAYFELGISPAE